MKNLFTIGLIWVALLGAGACSSKYAGGFIGKVDIQTFQENNTADSKELQYTEVIALVTPDGKGGATLEFSDAYGIGECKLKLDSLGAPPGYALNQPCEVQFDGSKEIFQVDRISFDYRDKNQPWMLIIVQGTNAGSGSGGKHFFEISFSGKPYENR